MYNTDMPSRAELPTSAQLLKSTLLAAGIAALLLVTVVLPAEYGIDPTGAGRVLGLKEMGDIKIQLHNEAEADRAPAPAPAPTPEKRSSLVSLILAQVAVGSAAAQTASPASKSEDISVSLKPGEGIEYKMDMRKGAKVTYSWKVEGGTVNHDTHGEPFNNPKATHSYKSARSVSGDQGTLEAAFDGNHGWFWRNRGSVPVEVKLTAAGEFGSLKQVK